MAESPAVLLIKRLANGQLADDGYEPLELWLLPVHMRTRAQYYQETAVAAKRDVEQAFATLGQHYESRIAFEQSMLAEHIWRTHSPFWWGLNDVIGYLDVQAHTRPLALTASLFLTSKRPSRVLKERLYVFRRAEKYVVRAGDSNAELRAGVVRAVEEVASDQRLKRRHVDVASWRIVAEHTDLVTILRQKRAVDGDSTRRE